MPKWAKTLIAVGLSPVSVGAARALLRVLRASSGDDRFWVAVLAGAAVWPAFLTGLGCQQPLQPARALEMPAARKPHGGPRLGAPTRQTVRFSGQTAGS